MPPNNSSTYWDKYVCPVSSIPACLTALYMSPLALPVCLSTLSQHVCLTTFKIPLSLSVSDCLSVPPTLAKSLQVWVSVYPVGFTFAHSPPLPPSPLHVSVTPACPGIKHYPWLSSCPPYPMCLSAALIPASCLSKYRWTGKELPYSSPHLHFKRKKYWGNPLCVLPSHNCDRRTDSKAKRGHFGIESLPDFTILNSLRYLPSPL